MNCFDLIGTANYPPAYSLLLSEQGDTAYSSSTSHVILILRGSAAPEPENRPKHATRGPENRKFLIIINLENTTFSERPCTTSFSAPLQWIDLKFSMRLDINVLNKFWEAHLNWTWRSWAVTEKPTKMSELFGSTGRSRSPTATNSITLRAGRYRLFHLYKPFKLNVDILSYDWKTAENN